MKIRLAFSILVAKLTIKLCRLVQWGGTSLPGKLARKIYPDVLKEIAKNFSIIMVTGTNGKTTTTRIIGQILYENKIDYITNRSGANLADGITTTFIEAVSLKGKSSTLTALLEVDEAAFKSITDLVKPDTVVVTNFFRDQLDRYGELYTTLNNVASGIHKSPKARLVLNADDSLCASLGRESDREVIYYGFGTEFTHGDKAVGSKETLNSDATFCLFCRSKYRYEFRSYGHLGRFRCPECGYERPVSHVTCLSVDKLTSSNSEIRVIIPEKNTCRDSADTCNPPCSPGLNAVCAENPSYGIIHEPDENQTGFQHPEKDNQTGQQLTGTKHLIQPDIALPGNVYQVKVNLPGLYNIYNALAAAACGYALGLPAENSVKALESFECGFGRMETINTSGKTIKLILVKNPTGFDQVIDYLLTEEKNMQLAFLINDKTADGTDISWLWDVNFEKLQAIQDYIENIYVSGIRAEDMAVRLKYADIYTDKISIQKDYNRLIDTALSRTAEGNCFYILPTYTAMLEIRKVLKKKFNLKEFWK